MNIPQTAKHLAGLFFVALMVGCSGSNTVSMSDPSADFGQYKTYNFVQTQSADGADYETIGSTYLKTATTREIGYRSN